MVSSNNLVRLFILLLLLTAPLMLYGQQGAIRLLTFSGYTFQDKIDFSNGYGQISDGFQWGAGLEIGTGPANAVHIYYQHLDTEGYAVPRFGDRLEADLGVRFIMVGGTRYAPLSDVVSAFGAVDVGLAVFVPQDDPELTNTTKFAWGVRAGVQIMPGEVAGIRLQAQLLSPVQAAGGGFYFGTGGSGIGVSTYSSIYQFNLGGSLVFRLK